MTDVGQKLALSAGRFFRALSGRFQVTRVHSQSIFRLLPFNELSDLAADRAHHLQQPAVGPLDLVAEELEYAQDLSSEEDREAECCVQTLPSRDRCAWKVRVTGHIFYPGGLGLRPDPARQTHARRKSPGVGALVELLDLCRWHVPGFHAAQQPTLLVNSPNSSHRPVETLTNSLQDPRSSAGQGRRLGEHARDRVLRSQARFFALSFRDIRRDSVNQSSFRADNGRPE